jgi:hypothetical protein
VNVELHQAFPECIQHGSVFVAGDTAAANKMFKTRCRRTPGRCKLEWGIAFPYPRRCLDKSYRGVAGVASAARREASHPGVRARPVAETQRVEQGGPRLIGSFAGA